MKINKLLVVFGIIGFLFFSGCSSKDDQNSHEGHNHATNVSESSADTVWTCPMHPEVQKSEPGVCPKCNMNLTKAEK